MFRFLRKFWTPNPFDMSLTKTQHSFLMEALVKKGIPANEVHIEFFDHLASNVEYEMAQGMKFEKSVEHVVGACTRRDLEKLLAVTLNKSVQHRSIQRQKITYGILLGLALSMWIFVEYVTGFYFGIPELGAVYGLLSELLIATFLVILVRWFLRRTYLIQHDFGALFKLSISVVFTAAVFVFVFMYFYIGWINHELYGLYDGDSLGHKDLVAKTIVPMTGVGIFMEGMFVSLIVAHLHRRKPAR